MSSTKRKSPRPVEPRNAASLVLIRRAPGGTRVLMGVRGAGARFMPERRVFPGGAVDPADLAAVRFAGKTPATCLRRLQQRTQAPHLASAFALTAIRETWEETGLAVGAPRICGPPGDPPDGTWKSFLSLGLAPAADRLSFVFRAVTPRSYPIRFDARFFLADADTIAGDVDDFSNASGELQDLGWLPLLDLMAFRDLPAITRFVLREVMERDRSPGADRPVPFFSDGQRTPPEELS